MITTLAKARMTIAVAISIVRIETRLGPLSVSSLIRQSRSCYRASPAPAKPTCEHKKGDRPKTVPPAQVNRLLFLGEESRLLHQILVQLGVLGDPLLELVAGHEGLLERRLLGEVLPVGRGLDLLEQVD